MKNKKQGQSLTSPYIPTEQNDKSKKVWSRFHWSITSQKIKMTGWMIFKPDEKLW